MTTVKITQADWDRVWLELAELRHSLNARPIAPTPDYRSDLPADEPCSCEESERLKAELGEAQTRLQSAENEMRRLGYGVEDIVCFGIGGTPLCMSHVGDLSWDTIENKRATVKWINERSKVEKDLLAQIDQLKSRVSIEVRTCADWVLAKEAADKRLAAANALLRKVSDVAGLGNLGLEVRAHLSGQPATPARPDAEQRVLDAVSAAVAAWQKGPAFDAADVIAAELARRDHG